MIVVSLYSCLLGNGVPKHIPHLPHTGKKYDIVSINTKLPEFWGYFRRKTAKNKPDFLPLSGRLTFVNVNVPNDVTIETLFDRIKKKTPFT